jgi:uncharacterized membrane protein
VYAVPFVPALVVLLRERQNRFVRLHAAQSLVFFALLALGQIALFAALVGVGNLLVELPFAAAASFVFYALYLIVGLMSLIIWLRLLGYAVDGTVHKIPLLTLCAAWIERVTLHAPRAFPSRRRA